MYRTLGHFRVRHISYKKFSRETISRNFFRRACTHPRNTSADGQPTRPTLSNPRVRAPRHSFPAYMKALIRRSLLCEQSRWIWRIMLLDIEPFGFESLFRG